MALKKHVTGIPQQVDVEVDGPLDEAGNSTMITIQRTEYVSMDVDMTAEEETAFLAEQAVSPTPSMPEGLGFYAAQKRYDVMCHGVMFDGLRIPGDDIARGRLGAAAESLVAGALTEPLTIVLGLAVLTATLNDINALKVALDQLTQAAFVVQGEVVTAINAGTITTTAQIDAAFAAMLAD